MLRRLILRADTPLADNVKHMIASQLHKADGRLAAIYGDIHSPHAPGVGSE